MIVFYSKSGNTRGVAERLNEKLKIEIDEIKAVSDDPNQTYVELTHQPDITTSKHIVLGSPVHGFSLPKVTKTYLDSLGDLDGKVFDIFVTHYFPFAWMGGSQTLKQMKKIILTKHGEVRLSTSINWRSKKREKVIQDMIDCYHL